MSQPSEAGAQGSGQVADRAPGDDRQEPSSASETYMAALWAEILGLEGILLSHKFLEVGGNSLTLNIILTRVEVEKGVALDPTLFFDDERSSLREVAAELDRQLAR